jgi:chromosomal replication initiator protein
MSSIRVPGNRDLGKVWRTVLGQLELESSAHHYRTFALSARVRGLEGRHFVVEGATLWACDWLQQKAGPLLAVAVREHLALECEPRFVPARAAAPTAEAMWQAPTAPRPAEVVGAMNCAFTFESYIRTEGNALAYANCGVNAPAGRQLANPLVLYGRSGVGKTHLLHALACRAVAAGRAVACLSAEDFANRYMTALRAGKLGDLQGALRGADLLVIDDLEDIEGRESTLKELSHTIDAVINGGGEIAIASERNPEDLHLPDRLKSRLAAGLRTRIEPFQYGERLAFARSALERREVVIPAWALDRLAASEAPSVRHLQGAVNAAISLEAGGCLDVRRLDEALAQLAMQARTGAGADGHIIEQVAAHFATTADEVASRTRGGELDRARAVAVAALRQRGRSWGELARLFSGRDRSTMKGLEERGQRELAEDGRLRQLLAG